MRTFLVPKFREILIRKEIEKEKVSSKGNKHAMKKYIERDKKVIFMAEERLNGELVKWSIKPSKEGLKTKKNLKFSIPIIKK